MLERDYHRDCCIVVIGGDATVPGGRPELYLLSDFICKTFTPKQLFARETFAVSRCIDRMSFYPPDICRRHNS